MCLLVVCRGLWKAAWWVVLGVHVDVHEDWIMLWVAAMYNVLAILSMAEAVHGVHEQCMLGLYGMYGVWCMVCSSYVVKFYYY